VRDRLATHSDGSPVLLLAGVVVFAAIFDFFMMRVYANGRGLSIY
jgi:hypothetical protein